MNDGIVRTGEEVAQLGKKYDEWLRIGLDPHVMYAASIFRVAPSEVTPSQRAYAKLEAFVHTYQRLPQDFPYTGAGPKVL